MRPFIFATILGGLAAVGSVAGAVYYFERPSILRVAVPRDSEDQAILSAAATGFADHREAIRLKLIPVADLAEASRALEDGHADLAVVRSDVSLPPSGQTVLILRHSAAVVLAPAASGLSTIDDLRGHRIGILQSGREDNQRLLDTALAQYEVSSATVKRIWLSLSELRGAIEQKEIDAVFAVGAAGSESLMDAVSTVAIAGHGAPLFLPIADAKAIAQRLPQFEEINVMRGAFGGAQPKPAEDFDTLGVSTRLVARDSLSDETAAEVARLILATRSTIAERIPIASRIEPPATDKGAALPVHPGVVAFLDDEQESFFDKYSDVFYIGAMCLSVLGTGLAAVATRLARHTATDADKILRRLIEIAKLARCAATTSLLDVYEEEADELLAEALTPATVHALSVNRMGALSLALMQLRHAIADRRQSLAQQQLTRVPFAPRVVRD